MGNKEKFHRYECSNCWNGHSNQRYPVYINSVTDSKITGKRVPDGMLCISAEDVDGHFCTVLKAYTNTKGERYCIFGKHRLYEGFRGPVVLTNVPLSIQNAIKSCGGIIE